MDPGDSTKLPISWADRAEIQAYNGPMSGSLHDSDLGLTEPIGFHSMNLRGRQLQVVPVASHRVGTD